MPGHGEGTCRSSHSYQPPLTPLKMGWSKGFYSILFLYFPTPLAFLPLSLPLLFCQFGASNRSYRLSIAVPYCCSASSAR
ncbi:uncharacterized protein BDW43DRAFT_276883 [Aspergillus alliaceus]|uniref:uncharacterized protein n=1 Tax=Petromyces alliaceus TaxID=209559 RepID=UPI0012A57C5B|nr:uncharacterized protein BDW43DRAFT_276883 [Aspergillus alliaceus]KAB8233284.1 hypothetical protein BDW43DRAFT_276883 [Aspergillus alliaceus]